MVNGWEGNEQLHSEWTNTKVNVSSLGDETFDVNEVEMWRTVGGD